MLQVRKYKHGVRSMESIIGMSLLKGRSKYERSCLPAVTQLDLHLDPQEFQNLVNRMELKVDREKLEAMAEETHEVFCEDLRRKGYKWGPQTSNDRKEHSSLEPFAELPEEEKEQNRGNVRDVPQKLSHCGLIVIPARGDEETLHFSEFIEPLAELEHNRWMKAKLAAGWRWGAETNKANRLHKDLLLWQSKRPDDGTENFFTKSELEALGEDPLPEEGKEKDRVLVRGIPRILEKGGFTIIRDKEAEK